MKNQDASTKIEEFKEPNDLIGEIYDEGIYFETIDDLKEMMKEVYNEEDNNFLKKLRKATKSILSTTRKKEHVQLRFEFEENSETEKKRRDK